MSCSNLVNTYTNARFIYKGVSRFRQSFECGCCSSCISKQRTDWRVRSYYESLSCLEDGGFVLFDTLTYNDDNVPHYSDIFPDMDIPERFDGYAFSRSDVQKFFKRLRINLKRAGFKFDSYQLRYILSSEFGSKQGCTHRPHYHILLYVRFPINPVVLSRIVSRSWSLGKTDGVKPYDSCDDCKLRKFCKGLCLYQSEQYVLNERVVSSSARANVVKCVNYVTKYISKDMYVSSGLKSAVDTLWQYFEPEYKSDYLLYKKYRRFCSQVLPFHLQSQGFGIQLIKDLGTRNGELDFIMKTNKVHLPTGEKDVVRLVALPRYYQKKLYWSFRKVDGTVKWYLTERGIDAKVAFLGDRIKSFMADYQLFDPDLTRNKLYDLALYYVVYRGTLSDYQSLMLPYWEYYRKMLTLHDDAEIPLYYNRNTKRDKMTCGSFLATRYDIDDDGEIRYRGKQLHREFVPYDGYLIVNDKVCSFWSGFDRKIAAFERWRKCVSSSHDAVATFDDAASCYYKSVGLVG